jgi:endonuclease/exonuclease/phosphatase (EEP) superfamily protein YafD
MKHIESSSGTPAHRPAIDQQAEVAELAAKVVALHRPGTVLRNGTDSRDAAAGPRMLPRHGWLWRICYLFIWGVTISLAIAALLRIFYHDGTHVLAWINAFTRYVYLPEYPCAIWAIWQRRCILALFGLAIIGCHVIWMTPDFVRDRRFDVTADAAITAANDSQTVRIFFANILATNEDYDPLWNEIAEADPDVVVLAECSRHSLKLLKALPLMAAYLHANGPLRSQHAEVVVYSKLPIKSERQNWVAGRIVQTVDIDLGSQTLRLIGLHSPRPMPPPAYDFYGYWKQMIPRLTMEQGPLVIVGDFNATEHSLVYKQLKAGGLRSAHDDRGRGYATTWPNGRWWLPPIRIDHAFLSHEVECESIAEGRGIGSDHKPLILDVRIRGHQSPESGSGITSLE